MSPLLLAKRKVQWRHFAAMLQAGIPTKDLVGRDHLKFGVVTIQGRELVVTDDDRLRSYLFGPGIFKFPIEVGDE